MGSNEHPFEEFLKSFVSKMAENRDRLADALWSLETTGSSEAADLAAKLGAEEQLLYTDNRTYQQLLAWDQDESLKDPLLKRQLNVLTRAFKFNQAPKSLIEEISKKEAELSQSYSHFRPEFEGKLLSENDVLVILKDETHLLRRQKAWEASKLIGDVLAPQILDIVALRNQRAQSLGYSDFFHMKLDAEEVDEEWLMSTFEDLVEQSEEAYSKVIHHIEQQQVERYGVSKEELGPWAWSDPFSQNDPLDDGTLDGLVSDLDIVAACERFFQKMGFDLRPVLQRSDLFERPNKNQHAFCINMDRDQDMRILANIKPYLNWLDGLLHELGHAAYELGFDEKLPWLLREPPSGIATEAIALLLNRRAYRYSSLRQLVGPITAKEPLMKKAEESFKRRQLILSRFVLVLTFFERELYRNPNQDLNQLWWSLVNKYQKIRIPNGRKNKNDWAAKFHIGLAPVYSFSYLLGEMFASAIEETLVRETGVQNFDSLQVGDWLQKKIFHQGNRMPWNELVFFVTGQPLKPDAWIHQFCSSGL